MEVTDNDNDLVRIALKTINHEMDDVVSKSIAEKSNIDNMASTAGEIFGDYFKNFTKDEFIKNPEQFNIDSNEVKQKLIDEYDKIDILGELLDKFISGDFDTVKYILNETIEGLDKSIKPLENIKKEINKTVTNFKNIDIKKLNLNEDTDIFLSITRQTVTNIRDIESAVQLSIFDAIKFNKHVLSVLEQISQGEK